MSIIKASGSGGAERPQNVIVKNPVWCVLKDESGTALGTQTNPIYVDGISGGTVPLPTGAATEATLATLNGKVTACNTGAVVVASSALPTGASTAALQTSGNASLTTIAGKDFATQTTLAAMNAKFVTGTDIGDVTINNGAGAAAVNVQDGGNSLTVDGDVSVTTVKPDGTNTMPSMDSATRAGYFVYGRRPTYFAEITTGTRNTTTGFMVIDLSDTTNWKHVNTGSIVVHGFSVNIDTDGFTGSVKVGFLSNVDATDGDLTIFREWDFTNKSNDISTECNLNDLYITSATMFAKVDANDTTFQTDVNLIGPDGAASYPSGSGDMVLKITRTGGNVIVNFCVAYETDS
jgi:hypothetical protein